MALAAALGKISRLAARSRLAASASGTIRLRWRLRSALLQSRRR
jgi:hypothetical protein